MWKETDEWEIADDVGVLYSGSKSEMRAQFTKMQSKNNNYRWKGVLKLVVVTERTR